MTCRRHYFSNRDNFVSEAYTAPPIKAYRALCLLNKE